MPRRRRRPAAAGRHGRTGRACGRRRADAASSPRSAGAHLKNRVTVVPGWISVTRTPVPWSSCLTLYSCTKFAITTMGDAQCHRAPTCLGFEARVGAKARIRKCDAQTAVLSQRPLDHPLLVVQSVTSQVTTSPSGSESATRRARLSSLSTTAIRAPSAESRRAAASLIRCRHGDEVTFPARPPDDTTNPPREAPPRHPPRSSSGLVVVPQSHPGACGARQNPRPAL